LYYEIKKKERIFVIGKIDGEDGMVLAVIWWPDTQGCGGANNSKGW
jgi:hypothetical protein